MKIVERIRPDRDSEDPRSTAYYQIERIIEEIKTYRYRDTAGLEIRFSVLPRELRQRQVEKAWKTRHNTDLDSFFDMNFDDSIYGYEPDYFKLELCLVIDYQRNIGELSVQPSPTGAKRFIGDVYQLEDLLKLFQVFLAVEIQNGDKAEFYLSDEPIRLSIDYDPSEDIIDADYGWSPSSPEECSDDERDTFFPNDR